MQSEILFYFMISLLFILRWCGIVVPVKDHLNTFQLQNIADCFDLVININIQGSV